MSHHDYARKEKTQDADDDDEHDPVEEMIKKTGCLQQHYDVQECMGEHRDWRMCQDKVKVFQACIAQSKKLAAGAGATQ